MSRREQEEIRREERHWRGSGVGTESEAGLVVP